MKQLTLGAVLTLLALPLMGPSAQASADSTFVGSLQTILDDRHECWAIDRAGYDYFGDSFRDMYQAKANALAACHARSRSGGCRIRTCGTTQED